MTPDLVKIPSIFCVDCIRSINQSPDYVKPFAFRHEAVETIIFNTLPKNSYPDRDENRYRMGVHSFERASFDVYSLIRFRWGGLLFYSFPPLFIQFSSDLLIARYQHSLHNLGCYFDRSTDTIRWLIGTASRKEGSPS